MISATERAPVIPVRRRLRSLIVPYVDGRGECVAWDLARARHSKADLLNGLSRLVPVSRLDLHSVSTLIRFGDCV